MPESGAILGCSICGSVRFVQIDITPLPRAPDGTPQVNAAIRPRDLDIAENFWKIHQEPWARALSATDA